MKDFDIIYEPLFSDIKIDELMNMTGFEIYKLWSFIPSDVLYSFSDFFNAQQLNALCGHYDKDVSQGAFDALV